MVSAAYYGHIRPTDHEFRLEHQTAHESFAEAYYRLRFGVAAKGVEFVEPPLLKVLAAAANYQEDAGGNPDPERS